MITRRRRVPELMDDPNVDRELLGRSLRFIRIVNRALGGSGAVLGHLRGWSARWPEHRPIRLLDVGTGSADIPLAIVRWARQAGRRIVVTGVDNHPTTLDHARDHVGDDPDVKLVQVDARQLTEVFDPGSFDYVHAGMFLHHLDDIEVLTVLRIMDRLASRAVIWNDLHRGPLEAIAVRVITAGQPPIVRHDAAASVAAGFTRREALDIARRVGLERARWNRHLFGRFTLVAEKG